MTKRVTEDLAVQIMVKAGLTPLVEYPGRTSKWLCRCNKCGNEAETTLASVKLNGSGCKPCGYMKISATRKARNPNVVQELIKFGAKPIEDFPGVNSPWKSRCLKCNKEISPRLGNLRNGHTPCVYCAKKRMDPKDAVKIMEANLLAPLVEYPGSNRPWKSKCLNCGDIVHPRYSSLVAGQGGCRKCGYIQGGKKQRVNSEVAIKFFKQRNFEPLEEFPGASKPWKSKCLRCGQIVSPQYSSIRSGSGCAVCGKRKIVPELAVKLMIEANLEPLEEFPGGKNAWKCRCMLCGNNVQPKYTDIQSGYGGCKFCGGHFIEPEIAEKNMKLHGLIPQTPYKNSSSKWHCVCSTCKRSVYPSYNSVMSNDSSCAYCAKVKVDPLEAFEVMKSVGVTPLTPYPGARTGWHSRCNNCNLEVFPVYSNVKHQKANPCLYCAGKKVDGDSAFRTMVNANLTPLEKYVRADKPWPCKCNKCNRVVTPTYTSIRIGQGGCKYCAEKGIDFTAPAFLYLMQHKSLSALKLGIGNHKTRNNRVNEHKKNGWELIEILNFSTGENAYQVEQSVLRWIRIDRELPPYLGTKEMPQGGWTETINGNAIEPFEVWAKVSSVIQNL